MFRTIFGVRGPFGQSQIGDASARHTEYRYCRLSREISHPWITSAKEIMNLPPVPFQKGPARNSPQQCYCKSHEQRGAGHHDLMCPSPCFPAISSLLLSRCPTRGLKFGPYLMPESKVPAGSQSQGWAWVLEESLGRRLAGEVGSRGVSKNQACLWSVYPPGARQVQGNTRADCFYGARSWG